MAFWIYLIGAMVTYTYLLISIIVYRRELTIGNIVLIFLLSLMSWFSFILALLIDYWWIFSIVIYRKRKHE